VTELAFRYQYGSAESFSHAFKKQYLLPPSVYKKRRMRFTDIYPKYNLSETEGIKMNSYTMVPYNTEELSEGLLSARGTYFLMADIDHMMAINEISREAGDAAIATTASRIERSVKQGMIGLRIGGEEFGVITGLRDAGEAEEIAKKIISFSDEEVKWSGGSFKFSLSIGVALIPEYSENNEQAIKAADEAMYKAKHNGRNTYYIIN